MHRTSDIDADSRTGTCSVCGPTSLVPKRDRRYGDLVTWRCGTAERDRKQAEGTVRRFGISREDYLARLDSQAGACAICGAPADHLDHDHSTGPLRDFLCRPCNVGLGHFGDDPARLRAAAAYLDRHANGSPA